MNKSSILKYAKTINRLCIMLSILISLFIISIPILFYCLASYKSSHIRNWIESASNLKDEIDQINKTDSNVRNGYPFSLSKILFLGTSMRLLQLFPIGFSLYSKQVTDNKIILMLSGALLSIGMILSILSYTKTITSRLYNRYDLNRTASWIPELLFMLESKRIRNIQFIGPVMICTALLLLKSRNLFTTYTIWLMVYIGSFYIEDKIYRLSIRSGFNDEKKYVPSRIIVRPNDSKNHKSTPKKTSIIPPFIRNDDFLMSSVGIKKQHLDVKNDSEN